ncbi:LysM domain protein [Xylariales sp. PMI_506]|nr:LysM domain protein [Xylariales sp. PMI_506]
MKYFAVLSSLALGQVGAYLVQPGGTAAPGANSACSEWVDAVADLTCAEVERTYGVSEADFESYNPTLTELGSGCTMIVGLYYCVQINYGASTATTTSSSASTKSTTTSAATTPTTLITSTTTSTVATTTSSGNGITTPTPIQPGMITSCDSFHYVVTTDTCYDLAMDNGISLDDFYEWNPAVTDTCAGLDYDYYVCVGIIGETVTTTTAATTTTAGNGITTPTPTQPGMVSDCDVFHLVVTNDSCYDLAMDAGISLDTFYEWNPAVTDTCAGLDYGYYVCIGTVDEATTTTATPTKTSGNGITTPTPTQPGMVSDCDVFHLVVTNDSCYDLAMDAGVSLDTFYEWNPAVTDTCADLDTGYYVCIGVE